jgi:methionyl-tRNA synthetase
MNSERVLITATPPTSNGDLHLGHLSGPYLAGDVFKRFSRLLGKDARFITGGDDNQSYVDLKARQMHLTPAAVAGRFNDAIEATLRQADIEVDLYVRPLSSPRHAGFIADFIRRLHAEGKLVARDNDGSWCERCQRYLYEAHISGVCPHCAAPADGNVCEACARPNQSVDLLDPRCKHCGGPATRRACTRLYFPLAPYASQLCDYFRRVHMGSHLAALCDAMLADGLPEIPISHAVDWGLPVPVAGFTAQRLYAWFEMAPGYLSATQEMLDARPSGDTWESWWKSADTQVVQFFGYDNGYFHSILFTSQLLAFDPAIRLPDAFVTNEFYRLEGLKFSTSRNHAIWGQEALAHLPVDVLRYYLCHNRPEAEQNNFLLAEFQQTVERELVGAWQPWLARLGRKARGELAGVAPGMGAKTAAQERFAQELDGLVRTVTAWYEAVRFSPQRVVAGLNQLVRSAHAFGAAESHWRPDAAAERGTAAALELAAAATLALLAAPIMPRFAARLRSDLGFPAMRGGDWPAAAVTVPAGQRLAAMEAPYFEAVGRRVAALADACRGAVAAGRE